MNKEEQKLSEYSRSEKHVKELRDRITYLESSNSIKDSKIKKMGIENSLMKGIIQTIKETTKEEDVKKICSRTLNNVEVYDQI